MKNNRNGDFGSIRPVMESPAKTRVEPETTYPKVVKRRRPSDYFRAGANSLRYILGREVHYYRKQPVDALFFITYRCTSKCRTCTLWQRSDSAGELSLDEWKRAVDMCHEMGVKGVELFGGDALLRLDVLIPLVAYIKTKDGMETDLVTNSNLLTDEVAEQLVAAGIDDIWFSIDGVSAWHNQIRGRDDAFEKVDKAIDSVLKARGAGCRPRIRANTTISNLNWDHFDEVLAYAESKGMDFLHCEYAGEFWDELLDRSVIDGVRPNPYFVRQEGRSILVTAEQARIIKAKLVQMKKDVRRMKISLQSENVDRLTIDQMTTGLCDNRRCYISRTKVTIDPRGNVVGCGFFGGWKLGNIKEQRLRDIWDNDRHRRFMKHFAKRDMAICDHCIMGVQRNPSFWQGVRNHINQALGRARQ
jgi:Fe-coproporphyrin III synthase